MPYHAHEGHNPQLGWKTFLGLAREYMPKAQVLNIAL